MSLSIGVIAAKPTVVDQIATLVETAGHRVSARAIVPSRRSELTAQLKTWIADPTVELVIGVETATMRSALLPLITRRLVGFTDLRDVDGGQCESTIVIMLPKTFSLATLEPILPRVERELTPRGRRQTTQPPPPPRPGSTQPPPLGVRGRSKTAPPPPPTVEEPDFIQSHPPSPEREFAEQVVSTISPIRLEQLPVVVRPIPQPPPRHTHRKWIAIGAAVVGGALFGGVMRAVSSSTHSSESPESPQTTNVEAQPVPAKELQDVSHIELGVAAVDISDELEPRPFDLYDPNPIEMPALRLRKPDQVPLWMVFTDRSQLDRIRTRSRLATTARVVTTSAPPPASPAAPAPVPARPRGPSAAQLWGSMDAKCDAISCAMDNFAQPCCDRYRMTDCSTSTFDFAQAASCHLMPRR